MPAGVGTAINIYRWGTSAPTVRCDTGQPAVSTQYEMFLQCFPVLVLIRFSVFTVLIFNQATAFLYSFAL